MQLMAVMCLDLFAMFPLVFAVTYVKSLAEKVIPKISA